MLVGVGCRVVSSVVYVVCIVSVCGFVRVKDVYMLQFVDVRLLV